MKEKYRYYLLVGNAKLENNLGQVKVTLLASGDLPEQPPLYFDSPLKFDTSDPDNIKSIDASTIVAGGEEEILNFNAGFDIAWFEAAVSDGFMFLTEDTRTPTTAFMDLELPDGDGDPMSVVRPKAGAGTT